MTASTTADTATSTTGARANDTAQAGPVDVDVVVVGAGFAGMYLLVRMRELGLNAVVVETGDDVGGTWYWNRYPGARCDIQSLDYSYSWDKELDATWRWTEKYAPQPEILRYAQHVADRHDLRRDIRFGTRVRAAAWDDANSRWSIETASVDGGGTDTITCRYYVMATGCLSVPKEVDITGTERFRGEVYYTGRWPHEGVDFTGKRVAVIGTGSSAIQSIPIIAAQADQLTVFQRTPNFSIPANNGPVPDAKRAAVEADRDAYREAARWTGAGVPVTLAETGSLLVEEAERLERYERAWQEGGIIEFLGCYNDHLANVDANGLIAEFVRNKIRSVVEDPETAETLCPKSFPIGAKRLCVDTNYYETFNRPNVRLVDLRKHPITTITDDGLDIDGESMTYDAIVFATGFDAMTGAVVGVDIVGRDGRTLREAWHGGPETYLGLMVEGFPNLFLVTGPGSPSVLSNMMVSIEQHVDWISHCIDDLRGEGSVTIEPTRTAVDGWVQHGNDFASLTLMDLADSWYVGANVPGKPRVFLPYVGGVDRYRRACNEVVARDYLGFVRRGPDGSRLNDGVVRRVQPDVALMLDTMALLELPPMESMSAADARAFNVAMGAARPPGPDVGEVVDGTLPGADGAALPYRLYRPSTAGPHRVVVYFHGGGWVIGSFDSDDPFCRDLCVRTDAIIVSVDYRHAPEARFPAAADDAFAALEWVAAHVDELGGTGAVAVAGWSAGGNLAAVAAQQARDSGGPEVAAQLLLTPVTDGSTVRESMEANADGFVLTRALMDWFWNHYADTADRTSPRASPLLAPSLAGLPPTVLVTCEFDPLRDEGDAYADALAAAGVAVTHIRAAGHIHTSLTAVDVLPTGVPHRAAIADALRAVLGD